MFQGYQKIQGLQSYKGLNISRVPKDPRASEFQEIEGPLVDKGFQCIGVSKIQRVSGKIYTYKAKCFKSTKRSKGFRVSRDRGSPYWQGLSMNWRLQNPKGFREIYIDKGFQCIGVSILTRSHRSLSPSGNKGYRLHRCDKHHSFYSLRAQIPTLLKAKVGSGFKSQRGNSGPFSGLAAV